MKRICTICARGGSKGVKGKNSRLLMNKPLIAHTIEQAISSQLFDTIAVSSDSKEILNIAEEYGVNNLVKRPDELATDTIGKLPVIKHCVETIEKITQKTFDIIVDLDATSPLRSVRDIKEAVTLLETRDVSNIITGAPARRSPYFNLVEVENGVVKLSKTPSQAIKRRQDSPKCYDMNASIYVWKRDMFFEHQAIFYDDTLLYIMPEERSLDIDSELDFEFVEYLMQNREGV